MQVEKIDWNALAAWAGFGLAIINFIKAHFTSESQKRLGALQSNAALLSQAWRELGKDPSLLCFHGVDLVKLKSAGITPSQLAYLIAHFEAAAQYYGEVESKVHDAFPESSLRYRMLESPETRNAWPLMRPFFASDELYVERIEKTIKLIERNDKTKQI